MIYLDTLFIISDIHFIKKRALNLGWNGFPRHYVNHKWHPSYLEVHFQICVQKFSIDNISITSVIQFTKPWIEML